MKTISLWIRKQDDTYFGYTPEFLAGQARTIDGEAFLLDTDANIHRWFAHSTPDAPPMKYAITLVSPFLRQHRVAIQTAIQEFDQLTRQWKSNPMRQDTMAVEVGVVSWELDKLNAAYTPNEAGVLAMPDDLAEIVLYVVSDNLFGKAVDTAFLS